MAAVKTVLCYGDSNTWGYDPAGGRFDPDVRWPGAMRRELGDDYLVVEEGLNARTTVWDDPVEGTQYGPGGEHKNGARYLLPCLESHYPLDLVVLMLGVNDLKARFSLPAEDIARSAGELVGMILGSSFGPSGGSPQVLLLAPPPVGKLTRLAAMFEGAEAKSREFGELYRRFAEEHKCAFLNAGDVVVASDLDGIHFERGEHAKLARAVADSVRKLLA